MLIVRMETRRHNTYLPNLKYFIANSIMEYLPELSSDLSDLEDFILSARLRVSPDTGELGSRFSKLPTEAAFFRLPGRAV